MKIGFDMLLWTTHVTEEDFPMLEKIKQIGYDGVEIPIFGGDVEHFEKVGKVIKDNGLACASVAVIPDEEHNPISADAKNREGAVQHLEWAIDCSAAMNSEVLCGPLYQPLGVFTGTGPTEEEKQRAAEVHRQVGDLAKKANLVLALEYLNRFEAYFLNTMADAVEYIKRVDHPNIGVHYDTFHANIEEKDPIGCISPNIDFIKHVHISENDRGTPGKGHINFSGTFKALRSSGYDSWLVIEAFGRALPDLAAATKVWRDLFPDSDGVYTEGLQFIQEQWKTAG